MTSSELSIASFNTLSILSLESLTVDILVHSIPSDVKKFAIHDAGHFPTDEEVDALNA